MIDTLREYMSDLGLEFVAGSQIFWMLSAATVLVTMFLVSKGIRSLRDVRGATKKDDERKRRRNYRQAQRDYERALSKLENDYDVVIPLIHDLRAVEEGRDRAETYINYDEAVDVSARIRNAKKSDNIIVVLHTLGGLHRPAQIIAERLKQHGERSGWGNNVKTEAHVPYVAMSGGTMIAVAADKVIMGKTARLGPIDAIVSGFQVSSFRRLKVEKSVDQIDDFTLLLSYDAERYEDHARDVARDLLNKAHYGKGDKKYRVAEELSKGEKSHSHALSVGEVASLGVAIDKKSDCSAAVYDLVEARIRMLRTRIEFDAERGRMRPDNRDLEGGKPDERRISNSTGNYLDPMENAVIGTVAEV